MKSVEDFVQAQRKQALEELMELLKIPSVSTDPSRKDDMQRCAQFVLEKLRAAGLEASILDTGGHPAVYGERLDAPGKPTLLVYGHYDVQPPEPLELWRNGPFTPTVEGEYLVARGSTDDKGQSFALVKGIEAAVQVHGRLPINVKVLIEGEEEIGSPHLGPLIRREKRRLACDYVVIADSSQLAKDIPAITYGLKGLVYLEVIVRGAAKDLHSGSYGGAVANPANVLARLIAACQGPYGKVAIPGFYDDVRPLDPQERAEFAKLPFNEAAFREETGAPELVGEEGYTTLERKWARPTFDVNGLVSGFTGEGAKTVLPSVARAKFSMRLVPDQEPEKIAALAREFLQEMAPRGVSIEILDHHGARPVLVPRTGKGVQAAVRAYTRGFGREPVFIREGGSIPVVNTFQAELGAPSLLLGLGLPDDDAHAPNEKFRIPDFYRGISTMAALVEELAK
ncbi:MAG TPA: dipeptidase [Planctomycetota bacterium]|jgi:acetylornithine deacetylase/succinyl-diaminopimelate desuccinylase-like protein|nr:dipeptidase [Planctomycetota bacterium]